MDIRTNKAGDKFTLRINRRAMRVLEAALNHMPSDVFATVPDGNTRSLMEMAADEMSRDIAYELDRTAKIG